MGRTQEEGGGGGAQSWLAASFTVQGDWIELDSVRFWGLGRLERQREHEARYELLSIHS